MDSKTKCGLPMQARKRAKLSTKYLQPLLRRRRSNRISTREKNEKLSKELLTLPLVDFKRQVTSDHTRKCNKSTSLTKKGLTQNSIKNINETCPIINNCNVLPEQRKINDNLTKQVSKLKPKITGINDNFCTDLLKQFTIPRFKIAHKQILMNIFEEITDINRVIIDGMEPRQRASAIKKSDIIQIDNGVKTSPIIQLLPKSEWVYVTPNKQRIRSMDELEFDDPPNIYEPAVLQMNKKVKTVFEVDEKLQQHIDLTKFDTNGEVPIDLNFMKPVCSVLINETMDNVQSSYLEVNQFLSARTEKSIDISQQVLNFGSSTTSFNQGTKRRRADDKDDLNWYEKHMKLLATCRPSKTVEKIDRRSFMQRKSLSFQEEATPKSHLCENKRFKSLDENASTNTTETGVDDFDTDFALLESEFYRGDHLDLSQTSQQLSSLFDSVDINEISADFFRRDDN